MKHDQRLHELEKTVIALKMIVEKQNDTVTELKLRVESLERQPAGTQAEYKPLFTQWPGNGR